MEEQFEPNKAPLKEILMAKKWIIVAGIVLVAVLVVGLVVLNRSDESKTTQSSKTAPKTEPNASLSDAEKQSLAELAQTQATLELTPAFSADIRNYQAVLGVNATKNYFEYQAPDPRCTLAFGSRTSAQQPGKDFVEMSGRLAQANIERGRKLTKKSSAAPLIFTSATDAAKQYTIPTVSLLFDWDERRNVVQYFSSIILKDGSRISFSRVCYFEKSRSVDYTALVPLDALLSKQTLKTE